MWTISNSTEDHRRREGNLKGEKSERETNYERLWNTGNKLRVSEGKGGGDNRMMGIEEGTCRDVHWALYVTNESLNTTLKTNDILYSG